MLVVVVYSLDALFNIYKSSFFITSPTQFGMLLLSLGRMRGTFTMLREIVAAFATLNILYIHFYVNFALVVYNYTALFYYSILYFRGDG